MLVQLDPWRACQIFGKLYGSFKWCPKFSNFGSWVVINILPCFGELKRRHTQDLLVFFSFVCSWRRRFVPCFNTLWACHTLLVCSKKLFWSEFAKPAPHRRGTFWIAAIAVSVPWCIWRN
jgi:hypothetical protein